MFDFCWIFSFLICRIPSLSLFSFALEYKCKFYLNFSAITTTTIYGNVYCLIGNKFWQSAWRDKLSYGKGPSHHQPFTRTESHPKWFRNVSAYSFIDTRFSNPFILTAELYIKETFIYSHFLSFTQVHMCTIQCQSYFSSRSHTQR